MKRSLLYPSALLIFIILGVVSGCASNSGSGSNPDEVTTSNQGETEKSIDLIINNVEADCLASGNTTLTVYLTAVDENSEPISDLDLNNFQVMVNSNQIALQTIDFSLVEDIIPEPVSVAILMDYSTSITDDTATRSAMEEAVVQFINLMQDQDQAEILKFNNGVRYIQPFTDDKAVLIDAVRNEDVAPGSTYLFDSLYESIEDVSIQDGRRAVVAITDGEELHEPNLPGDGRTMQGVITLANNYYVPLFLIGLTSEVDEEVLLQMADQTGGHFYQAATVSELEDIYSDISDLLNEGQYRMVFEIESSSQTSGSLTVQVTYDTLTDSVDAMFTY